MGAPFTEKGSCRWTCHKYGGLASDFCSACTEQAELSDRELRRRVKSRTLVLEGSCLKKKQASATGVTVVVEDSCRASRRTRHVAVKHEATATGKMHAERAPDGMKKRKKRRLSVLRSRQAEAVFKKPGGVKEGLVRKCLAFVAGKENISITRKTDKVASKSTEYRMRNSGAAVVNGAAIIMNSSNPTAFRAQMMAASLAAKPSLENQQHPAIRVTPLPTNPTTNVANTATLSAPPPPPPPPPPDIAKKLADEREAIKLEGTRVKMCDSFIAAMKLHGNPELRRPFLACFADSKKPDVEKLCGNTITDYEFTQAKLHSKWPGPLKSAPKSKQLKQRIPIQTLTRFFEYLESPGILQRYAFGTRLLQLCNGKDYRELENIDTLKKVQTITTDFIMALDSEIASDESSLPAKNERCCKLERDTQRRCMYLRRHGGKCKFTPTGSLSRSTVIKLVKTLTGGEVKTLAGLDDVKVLKGRDNFDRLRELARDLVDDTVERQEIISSIDDSEVFYQTDFVDHLRRHSNQACNCLSCGFSCDNTGVICEEHESHNPACIECVSAYAVISKFSDKLNERKLAAANSGLPSSQRTLQELDEYTFDLQESAKDLTEYRSHLARHKAEGDFDLQEMRTLPDNTAIVVSDWKMKILSCFFRENQAKWFGKRGTSCLGFMIISNAVDDATVQEKGIKEVQFAMMFTDDTKQDDQAVASAKREIYSNHLPDHVDRVIFCADGASCFKSAFHRGLLAAALEAVDWY